MKRKHLFIRGLKKIDFSVLCVDSGQKTYYDPISGKSLPYSSGQQVKKSIMNNVYENSDYYPSPVVFVLKKDKDKMAQKEALSTCDPTYFDQLIAGYMYTPSKKDQVVTDNEDDAKKNAENLGTIKSKAHISVGAMIPFNPNLAQIVEEKKLTYHIENPIFIVKNEENRIMSDEDITKFLDDNNAKLSKIKMIDGEKRVTGIFRYDIDVDLERLFRVEITLNSEEVSKNIEKKLIDAGWKEVTIKNKKYLELPKEFHFEYASLLANAFVNWRINSNTSRTFDLMPTFAVAVCGVAKHVNVCMQYDSTVDNNGRERKGVSLYGNANNDVNLFVENFSKEYVINLNDIDETIVLKNYAISDAEMFIRDQILDYYDYNK